jgi:hypothetical protein
MRASPVALVLASVALGSAAVVSACSGAVIAGTDPLNTRDRPVSNTDPVPGAGDVAPPGYEGAPAGTDPAPVAADPANQNGSNICIPCSGNYLCSTNLSSETAVISLDLQDNTCHVTGSIGGQSSMSTVQQIPGCGTELPEMVTADGIAITVARVSGGGFKVCVDVDAGVYCATCVPTSETAGSGSGATSSTQIIESGPTSSTSNGGGGGCSALSSCCNMLPSLEQQGCRSIVSLNNATECSSTLTGYQDSQLCH